MSGKRWIRGLCMLLLMSALIGGLTSCEEMGTEPEQGYLVSAMGFDPSEEGIRVTIEIPVIGEGNGEESKTILFTHSGASVKSALEGMQRGIPRELVFSHCALTVLGDGLKKEALQEIFAFAEAGESLPLAAEVVRSTNAEKLLRAGSLSAPAVGYEIPELLRRERERMGVEMRCRIYELRTTPSPDLPVAIPRLESLKMGESSSVRLEGMEILRPNAGAIRLPVDDWIPYAVLSNRFTGGENGGERLGQVKRTMTVEYDGEAISLSLNLKMKMIGGTDTRVEELQSEICTRAEALFSHVRDTVGEDLFWLGEEIKRNHPEIPLEDAAWIRRADMKVTCEINGKG